jgi:dUTP pyrophosphatase
LDHCNGHCLPQAHDVFTKQVTLNNQEPEIAHIQISDMITLPVKFKSPMAKLPMAATPNAASLDLYANESLVINPGSQHAVGTGIRITLPHHMYGCIAPQSGLAVRHCIDMGAGVIDQDYTGELKVL